MRNGLRLSPLIFLLIACAGCTTGGRKDVAAIENFGQVTPDVWRGGKPSRQGMQWLAERGVKTIIDLQMDDESAIVPAGVKYVPIRTSLWSCDRVDVAAVSQAIDQSPKPVFIHCLVGRDRTGLAVAAWQMSHGMSADDAIADNQQFGGNPWFDEKIRRRIRQLAAEQETNKATKISAEAR